MFLVFLSAPTIISAVDDSYDVSMFYNINNEEENNNLNEIKKLEFHLNDGFCSSFYVPIKSNKILDSYLNLYSHLNNEIPSPPPEHYML